MSARKGLFRRFCLSLLAVLPFAVASLIGPRSSEAAMAKFQLMSVPSDLTGADATNPSDASSTTATHEAAVAFIVFGARDGTSVQSSDPVGIMRFRRTASTKTEFVMTYNEDARFHLTLTIREGASPCLYSITMVTPEGRRTVEIDFSTYLDTDVTAVHVDPKFRSPCAVEQDGACLQDPALAFPVIVDRDEMAEAAASFKTSVCRQDHLRP